MIERTFTLIKPDAVQRRIAGQIILRFENKGLKIAALRMTQLSKQDAETLYAPHKGKDFFTPLTAYITSGPVIAMLIEGPSAISIVRSMVGKTFGPDAEPGTIRGDFTSSKRFNLIHASDCEESYLRESVIFFAESDIPDYSLTVSDWEFTEIDL